LAAAYSLDVFVEGPPAAGTSAPDAEAGFVRRPAHDFVWRHALDPYDLVIYQLGNATCHDYMWAYLARFPGLVVLHDAQVHQARARSLIEAGRLDQYRTALAADHPAAPRRLADLVIDGFGGSLYYYWPMVRSVVQRSKVTAVHNPWLAAELEREIPGRRIATIRMGVADPWATPSGPSAEDAARARDIRERYGIRPETMLCTAFGHVTPEKRIGSILRALAALSKSVDARLMLVGETRDYYDVRAEASQFGVAELVTVTGYIDERAVAPYLQAADVCLCLRWPSARETSASWLRCLAAGRPTVISELAHTSHVPAVDPRGWTPLAGEGPDVEPVAVAVDVLDELRSLTLAIRRLAADPMLRHRLAHRARSWWASEHTLDRMVLDYRGVLDQALADRDVAGSVPGPPGADDASSLARTIAREVGVSIDFLEG
jgi:glycosyltransferase involved in cell wall biosynthesis